MTEGPATPHPERPRPARRARAFALHGALALVAGLAMAAQARVNGELGRRLGDGVAAAAVSFGVGLLALLLTATAPAVRAGAGRARRALRAGDLRPWQVLGGAGGAFLVLGQGLTATALGIAVFTVAMVAGQAVASLLVDRLGLGPAGRVPVDGLRLGGAALAVVAVAVAVLDRAGAPSELLLALVPLAGGAAIAWQQAVNGRVNAATGQPLATALVNFAVGAVLLTAAALVTALVRGAPDVPPAEPVLYLGGLLGVVAVTIGAVSVGVVGVLVLGLTIVAGQLAGAVVLDLLLPAQAGPPGPGAVAGAGLALLAAGVAAAGSLRRGRPGRPGGGRFRAAGAGRA